ncbi:U-box domain-containing protein 39-like [Phragmites australis]|uniref:U-box domain-containing protein 39-like n=1 Tax=Phragmites australis TaxID=29695 RepID=UPI002D77821D|nr:U-box domain-containing protein 39-like [Phragmites australis]
MGAARARCWKLLPFRSQPPAREGVPVPEEVPVEFLCPVLGTPMADPVILPSGRTYERACVQACVKLGVSLGPNGVLVGEAPGGAVVDVAIPNDALRAAVRTWCARSGRAAPVAPSAEKAREGVLRAVPPVPSPAPARSSSNLSCSSSGASAASTSSSTTTEIAAVEVEVEKEAVKEKEAVSLRVGEAEEEAVAKAVEAGDEREVEAAMAALRRATREGTASRRALCGPRLLAALRRVLLSSRHTASARADAAAVLANLSLEPENRVPIVRAGAVPALVEVIASTAAPPEACEHAAGALFGLALHEGNRAAIGMLGAVPPLLAVIAASNHAPRARHDAGMALYHLSLFAVNQSKLARAPGAARNLLSIAREHAEPSPIRRLALMVVCNVAACAEGRTALMDAGAVATVTAILSDDARNSELQEWCVAALYGMSRGSPRFRGLARAAGADRPLILIAEQANPGVHKGMAQTALRTMLGLGDSDLSDCRDSEGYYGASAPPHRRRVASWGAPPAATPPSSHQCRSVCID